MLNGAQSGAVKNPYIGVPLYGVFVYIWPIIFVSFLTPGWSFDPKMLVQNFC